MKNSEQIFHLRTKFILGLIIIIFIVAACRKENNETFNEKLNGKWIWVKSIGGFGGQTYTPQSTGETIIIEFMNDSIYKEYYNGNLSLNTTFIIDSIDGVSLIKYKNKVPSSIIDHLDGIHLILRDYATDSYVSTYTRK